MKKYLDIVFDKCPNCFATALPQKTRKVSPSYLNRSFNDVLYIDHFCLECNSVFHITDCVTRYSIGDVVDKLFMSESIRLFDTMWIT